jgi:hypothetical protein
MVPQAQGTQSTKGALGTKLLFINSVRHEHRNAPYLRRKQEMSSDKTANSNNRSSCLLSALGNTNDPGAG